MDINEILKVLRKKYYDEIVYTLDNFPKSKVSAIPTGSYSIDICSGIGGIPRGRSIELFGSESTGKSSLCYHIVAQAQKMGLLCAYIDTEASLDLNYAATCGVDPSKLIISQPASLDEGLNLVEDLVEIGDIGLIIFDSVAGVSPQKELDDDLSDSNVGQVAKLLSKFFRRNSQKIADKNVTVVFTNQVRDVIGTFFPTFGTPGGHAFKHFAAMRIMTSSAKKEKSTDDEVNAVNFTATFKKNKLAVPFKVATFKILFGQGIYQMEDLLTNCVEYGIITQNGTSKNSALYTYNNETLGKGIKSTIQTIIDTEGLKEQLESELRKIYDA